VKRYHEDIPLMERRSKEYIEIMGGIKSYRPKGYFRKRHPLDCGKSRCRCCHGETKFPKRTPTRQELLSEDRANQDQGIEA